MGLGFGNGGVGLGGSGFQQAVVDGKQRLAGDNQIALGHVERGDATAQFAGHKQAMGFDDA